MNSMTVMGVVMFAACQLGAAMQPTEYFVDSENGDDAAIGTSPSAAWRTVARVNQQAFQPGDVIRFKRGGLWRGELLRPTSGVEGKPVTYTAYGTGTKPILQMSMDFSKPTDWVEIEKGLWATRLGTPPKATERIWQMPRDFKWRGHFEAGYQGTLANLTEGDLRFVRIACTNAGARAQHNFIQLHGPIMPNMPQCFVLKTRMRASKPIKVPKIQRIRLNRAPFFASNRGRTKDLPRLTAEWREVEVLMENTYERIPDSDRPLLHISLGDILPQDTTFDLAIEGAYAVGYDHDTQAYIPYDVGNLIINHGEKWGIKKWETPDWHPAPTTYDAPAAKIEKDFDFAYDPKLGRVLFKHPTNPGETYDSIELAMTQHIIRQNDRHDIIYDGLWLRYTGAYGMQGGNTKNLITRNCDFSWIGGGLMEWAKNSKTLELDHPIRYGNGIEFWSPACSNLVERCRFWQVYDAALSPQSTYPTPIFDIVFRDNVIWQSEFSFEYWHHHPKSYTANIYFEHNTCIDAGGCWSHTQRPRPNGAHLMFYSNEAACSNIVVRDNIFCRTVDRSTRLWNNWLSNGVLSHNLYWIPQGKILTYEGSYLKTNATAFAAIVKECSFGTGKDEFARYQKRMNVDLDSIYGEPLFENESAHDYRLKPGSPGKGAASDGTDIGARNMPGLE